MKKRTIYLPEDCVGAVVTALRIRILYLQSYRVDCDKRGYVRASEAIMKDIANLTMVMDNVNESIPL